MTDRPRTLSFALSTKGFTFDLHFSRLGETTNASIAVIPKYASLGGMLLNNLSASVTRHKGKGGDVENPAAGMRYDDPAARSAISAVLERLPAS